MIGKILTKVRKDQSLPQIITLAWQCHDHNNVRKASHNSTITENHCAVLRVKYTHSLQESNQLQFMAQKVSEEPWKMKEY